MTRVGTKPMAWLERDVGSYRVVRERLPFVPAHSLNAM